MKKWAFVIVGCFQVLASKPLFSQSLKTRMTPQIFRPHELLVKFKSSQTSSKIHQSLLRRNVEVLHSIPQHRLKHIQLPATLGVEDAIQQFQADDTVEKVQPNYIKRLYAVPNDSKYGQLWGLKNTGQTMSGTGYFGGLFSANNPGSSGEDIGAESAWALQTDCSSVVIAVVDSGINYNHADLAANMWDGGSQYPHHGYNFIDNNSDPMDVEGHGTHVAGTIAAVGNNGMGSVGICWRAKLMALRVGDAAGMIDTASEVEAIDFAVAQGSKIMNMSFGSGTSDPAEQEALSAAADAGVIAVVAAGNSASDNELTPDYPCDYGLSNIICVAALDQDFSLASFSNWGSQHVNITAPGVNIVSTAAGSQTLITDALSSGWTFSSPHGSLGWGYSSFFAPSFPSVITDPPNYDMGAHLYSNSADDRAYKNFSLSGYDSAALNVLFNSDTQAGHDFFKIAMKASGGDPFSTGGTTLISLDGSNDNVNLPLDLTSCLTSSCSLGFDLGSDSTTAGTGVAIGYFSIDTLTWNNSSYDLKAGTSMATPHVVGVAALVASYNPGFEMSDVIHAVVNGGVPKASLSSLTTSGKTLHALGALTYINAPMGISVQKN